MHHIHPTWGCDGALLPLEVKLKWKLNFCQNVRQSGDDAVSLLTNLMFKGETKSLLESVSCAYLFIGYTALSKNPFKNKRLFVKMRIICEAMRHVKMFICLALQKKSSSNDLTLALSLCLFVLSLMGKKWGFGRGGVKYSVRPVAFFRISTKKKKDSSHNFMICRVQIV